jgi:hypothetical protein
VRLAWSGEDGGVRERLMTTLNDLSTPFDQDDVRPTYRPDFGQAAYDGLVSNASFAYRRRGAGADWAGLIHGTYLENDGQVLFEAPAIDMFQENGTSRPGTVARLRWTTQ